MGERNCRKLVILSNEHSATCKPSTAKARTYLVRFHYLPPANRPRPKGTSTRSPVILRVCDFFRDDNFSWALASLYPNMNCHPDRSEAKWRACPERSRMGTCGSLHQPPDANGSAALPLSSRAQPRDLQFCRPVLEMFFDRVLMQVEVKVCRAYGARTMLGNRAPALPGWADVWRSAPSTSSGQALRASKPRPLPRKTFPGRACRTADPSASLGMTKGRAALPFVFDAGRKNRRSPFDFAQGRLSTSLRSGRDDNSYLGRGCECPRKIVIRI